MVTIDIQNGGKLLAASYFVFLFTNTRGGNTSRPNEKGTFEWLSDRRLLTFPLGFLLGSSIGNFEEA